MIYHLPRECLQKQVLFTLSAIERSEGTSGVLLRFGLAFLEETSQNGVRTLGTNKHTARWDFPPRDRFYIHNNRVGCTLN